MVSTVSGALIGERIAIDISLMSYALTAMFIGLWSFYVQKKSFLLIGLFAGVLGLVFFPFYPTNFILYSPQFWLQQQVVCGN
jgi:predicted branched-subunit amino acid permease